MSTTDRKTYSANINPLTEIKQVAEAEADNLRSSMAALGERCKLANDVLALYDLIAKNANLTAGRDEPEIGALMVMLSLLAGCRFQLTMSVLQNWRGRTAEVLAPLRRATELCASACLIRRQPGLAVVWLSASDSDEAYKRHKHAFNVRAIFPKADPILNRLFEIFDFSSKALHCSIFSVAGQTKAAPDFRFEYFDIKGTNDPALIRTFIYIISAHEAMLKAFAEAFRGALKDEAAIDGELRIFSERLQRHRDSNREFAMSDVSPEAIRKHLNKRKT